MFIMKNFAFAKIGKSIKFSTTSFSPIGGDNEPGLILQALANSNPDKTFYLVGRSDFSRLSPNDRTVLFPYDNVVDCFENAKAIANNPNYLIDWFKNNNVSIDFAFMMMGQIGTVCIPNRVRQIKNPELIASVIVMAKNYATPTINWLNENPNLKWIEIINDPRYTKAQTRDFISEPVKSLSQYDYTYVHKRINSFEDQSIIEVGHEVKYAGMETGFCINRNYPDISKIKKTNKFIIILNEGKPSRYNTLNEWVLSKFNDVEVYGKWEHKSAITDSRFRGSVHIEEVQRKVTATKYTFIIPIDKGWVTSKYIEMIHAGCIPFFHPSYDEQNHLNVPDIIRVKTPQQLLDTIELMENDEDLRISTLKELQKNILKEEYYTGEFINNMLMNSSYNSIGETYKQCDVSKYTKNELIQLI